MGARRSSRGRHLQNLDQDSGLNSQTVQNRVITAAVQEQDVEFKTEAEDGWKVLYNDMTFKPIENKPHELRQHLSEHEQRCGIPSRDL